EPARGADERAAIVDDDVVALRQCLAPERRLSRPNHVVAGGSTACRLRVRNVDLVIEHHIAVLPVLDASVVEQLPAPAERETDARAPVAERDVVDEARSAAVLVEDESTAVTAVVGDVDVFEGDVAVHDV